MNNAFTIWTLHHFILAERAEWVRSGAKLYDICHNSEINYFNNTDCSHFNFLPKLGNCLRTEVWQFREV